MTINVKTTSCEVEFNIDESATVDEYIDAIFYALLIEGFSLNTIIKGCEEKISESKEDNDGQE